MNVYFASIDDQTIWEKFLLMYAPQALFQSWDWGEVQRGLGQNVYRVGMYEDNLLVGIAQVVIVRARRGPFLHVRHGPIFAAYTQKRWLEWFSYIKNTAKKDGLWFVRMSPLLLPSIDISSSSPASSLVPAPIHAMDGERCWVLDITKPEEQLLSDMRKTTRYEIRRAEKSGVMIEKTEDQERMQVFLDLYKNTSSRHGFVEHKGIAEEFRIFKAKGQALLMFASYEGVIGAGALVLFYGNQAIYHHGASISMKIPLSYVLQWEAIREAKKRGKNIYNFWGIAEEGKIHHPWNGLTLFKKGFGGQEQRYLHAVDLPVSPLYIFPRIVETIRRVRKGY